mmetsp:Transcript_17212/g.41309  ORF Transcript_17212/g.41309 Transcript_17212/m.41309 type:complete len:89 (-) Transcript_17212:81-347(-)
MRMTTSPSCLTSPPPPPLLFACTLLQRLPAAALPRVIWLADKQEKDATSSEWKMRKNRSRCGRLVRVGVDDAITEIYEAKDARCEEEG